MLAHGLEMDRWVYIACCSPSEFAHVAHMAHILSVSRQGAQVRVRRSVPWKNWKPHKGYGGHHQQSL